MELIGRCPFDDVRHAIAAQQAYGIGAGIALEAEPVEVASHRVILNESFVAKGIDLVAQLNIVLRGRRGRGRTTDAGVQEPIRRPGSEPDQSARSGGAQYRVRNLSRARGRIRREICRCGTGDQRRRR